MKKSENATKQNTLMGQPVQLSDADLRTARALLICAYCDPSSIKNVPIRTITNIVKGSEDINLLEQKRVELISTIGQVDAKLQFIRHRMQGMADVAIDLIDPEKFEELAAQAEINAIKDMERAQKEYNDNLEASNATDVPEKEKVVEHEFDDLSSESNVVEGNFKKDDTDDSLEDDSDISNPSVAGSAGKIGVSNVIEKIEEANRDSAVAKDIESEKK